MQLKTFTAKSLREALNQVQQHFGPDAAILRTHESWDGWRGLFGKRVVQVTAATGVATVNDLCGPFVPSWERTQPADDSQLGAGPDKTSVEDGFPSDYPPTTDLLSRENAADDSVNFLVDYRAKFRRDLQQQDALDSRVDLLHRPTSPSRERSELLFRLFTELVDANVDDRVARSLIAELRDELPVDEGLTRGAMCRLLKQIIQSKVGIRGPIELVPGVRRVVALVGPTGVGKTTTIAKLAANFRLRQKKRVGLITVDTYRIAAVDQLRTYADIIDLPMEVVASPQEMQQAVRRLSHLDLILMDTAGQSRTDERQLGELQNLLEASAADEVHLVLSSTTNPKNLIKTAQQFDVVRPNSLLLTKLDESTSVADVLPLLESCSLPLSYLTHGQDVPDDIQVATRDCLLQHMFGDAWDRFHADAQPNAAVPSLAEVK